LVDAADDPEVAILKKDKSEILRRCLTTLSPAHREMIDLVYYPEKSIEEVTELVGARALRRGSDYHTCSKSEA
jgi:RNA polymerase sigma-70 factor (ECF subfamily)